MKKGRFSVPFVLFFFFVLFGLYQCGQISFCEIVYGHPDGVQHDRLTEQHPQDVYPINRLSAEQKPYQRQTEGVYQHGGSAARKGFLIFDVISPATRVQSVPKTRSDQPHTLIKLDKKQPIVSPATEKGNREGRMVMASAMRNWIAPKLIN